MNNFASTVSRYETVLGIDTAELEQIQESAQAYDEALAEQVKQRAIALGATEQKDAARDFAIRVMRPFVATFQANQNIPPNVFAELLIPKRGARGSKGEPQTPTDVMVKPQLNGNLQISFSRNGNPRSATFQVEAWMDGEWVTVIAAPRTRFALSGFPVGTPVSFRVIAVRAGRKSVPSAIVTAYAEAASSTNDQALSLAA